jgi:hypothetical protein
MCQNHIKNNFKISRKQFFEANFFEKYFFDLELSSTNTPLTL